MLSINFFMNPNCESSGLTLNYYKSFLDSIRNYGAYKPMQFNQRKWKINQSVLVKCCIFSSGFSRRLLINQVRDCFKFSVTMKYRMEESAGSVIGTSSS